MHKKIVIFSLLTLQTVFISAMDFELKPIYLDETEVNWNSCFLRTDNLRITTPDVYVGGQANTRESDDDKKESGELLYLDAKDPIKQVSFRELITEQHKKDMAYILAVLLVQDKHGKYVRYYHDATSLVSRMFDNKMVRTQNKHIVMKRKIENPILFFTLFPEDKDFKYLKSESNVRYDLTHDNLKDFDYFFLVNVGRKKDGFAFNWAGIFCDKEGKKELKLKYYLKAIELKNTDAMFNYAANCWVTKRYEESEKYSLMAIECGDTDIACFIQLAQIYLKKKKYDLAQENIEKIKGRGDIAHKGLVNMMLDLLDEKLPGESNTPSQ